MSEALSARMALGPGRGGILEYNTTTKTFTLGNEYASSGDESGPAFYTPQQPRNHGPALVIDEPRLRRLSAPVKESLGRAPPMSLLGDERFSSPRI